MTYRVRNILIAVALAVVAGLLTLFYVTSYKKHVDSQQKSVSVLVAKDDIPAGVGTAESVEASSSMIEHDQAVVADLFADIAATYARPVKNFIFELRRGTATREWIEICRPAMRSISKAAESMGLSAAADRMNDFDEALSLAQDSDERVLGVRPEGDLRQRRCRR